MLLPWHLPQSALSAQSPASLAPCPRSPRPRARGTPAPARDPLPVPSCRGSKPRSPSLAGAPGLSVCPAPWFFARCCACSSQWNPASAGKLRQSSAVSSCRMAAGTGCPVGKQLKRTGTKPRGLCLQKFTRLWAISNTSAKTRQRCACLLSQPQDPSHLRGARAPGHSRCASAPPASRREQRRST